MSSNNQHYQLHTTADYDNVHNFPTENDHDEALHNALNRGPYFDTTASKNVTALVGTTAYLNCRVKNLGNKTVNYISCNCRMEHNNVYYDTRSSFLLYLSFQTSPIDILGYMDTP